MYTCVSSSMKRYFLTKTIAFVASIFAVFVCFQQIAFATQGCEERGGVCTEGFTYDICDNGPLGNGSGCSGKGDICCNKAATGSVKPSPTVTPLPATKPSVPVTTPQTTTPQSGTGSTDGTFNMQCQCRDGFEWCTYPDGKSYKVDGSESKCASSGNPSASGTSAGGGQGGSSSSNPSGASPSNGDVTDLEEVTVTASGCPSGTTMKNNLCVPTGTGLSEMSVQQLLLKFLNWLLAIIGFLALLAFLISGAQYLLAFGDDGMIETAKNNMKWSLVGVAVAFGSYVIVQAVGMLFG